MIPDALTALNDVCNNWEPLVKAVPSMKDTLFRVDDALQMQIPQKPIEEDETGFDGREYKVYRCRNCLNRVSNTDRYCRQCGQRIYYDDDHEQDEARAPEVFTGKSIMDYCEKRNLIVVSRELLQYLMRKKEDKHEQKH